MERRRLVAAGGALDSYRDQVARERYAEDLITQAQDFIGPYQTMEEFDQAQGLSQLTGYSDFTGRLKELTDKAKANNITNSELQELASLNAFEGENPTTGMGIVESLRYQATRPDLGEDLAGLGNVLGLLSGNPIKMGISALKMYGSTKPKSFNKKEKKVLLVLLVMSIRDCHQLED